MAADKAAICDVAEGGSSGTGLGRIYAKDDTQRARITPTSNSPRHGSIYATPLLQRGYIRKGAYQLAHCQRGFQVVPCSLSSLFEPN